MNEFMVKLLKFEERMREIQQKEATLGLETETVQADFQAFLKENGVPVKFTLADAMTLAVRKSRE